MTEVRLIGMYDDGARLLTGFVRDVRVPLRVMHRVPTDVVVEVQTPVGAPLPLVEGDQFALVVKEREDPCGLPVIQVAGTRTPTRGPNFVTFTLTAALTDTLAPKHYQYDAWMVRSGAGSVLIPTSLFILERTIYAP